MISNLKNLFKKKKKYKTFHNYLVIDITNIVNTSSEKYTFRDYQQMDFIVNSSRSMKIEVQAYDFKEALDKALKIIFRIGIMLGSPFPIEAVFAIRKNNSHHSKKFKFFNIKKELSKEVEISRFKSKLDTIKIKKNQIRQKIKSIFPQQS